MQKYDFEPNKYETELLGIITDLLNLKEINPHKVDVILKKYPKDKNKIFSRDQLISGIYHLINRINSKDKEPSIFSLDSLKNLIFKIKMKPMRSESGVTTVTVLTKPFACPGLCIFCPNDVRMPKSYIATEPGAQRALMNRFSPYGQVFNRLRALRSIGHPTEKIELLILGGTWSYYPKKYQIWFIHECFKAMNDFGENPDLYNELNIDKYKIAIKDITNDLKNDFNNKLRVQVGQKPYNQILQTKEFKEYFKDKVIAEEDRSWEDLKYQQDINSLGKTRCVGLVLETRPDSITAKEVLNLRRFGATKIQLGIQTLDDEISKLNKRGENKQDSAQAFRLLRAGGFKIHAHIMPNLYGATPEKDLETYKELFESENYKPDELKIYPTSLIKNTELYTLWKEGKYTPYSTSELVNLISKFMEITPEYCRLTRIIRDIPSTEIEDGNTITNLREIIERGLAKDKKPNNNIRAREIKNEKIKFEDLKLDILQYKTSNTKEYFLQFVTNTRQIAGFLRLSILGDKLNPITEELDNCAIIREIHVYGPSLELNKDSIGEAQHLGLGTKLIERAKQIVKNNNISKLAVISSIGTREYYMKRGFILTNLYQIFLF